MTYRPTSVTIGDATYLPVPNGVTLADAEAALADAGAWVEVEDLSGIPKGVRVRSEWKRLDQSPEVFYVRVRSEWKRLDQSPEVFHVHRDLPPTDPDAELVEKMARALCPAHKGTEHLGDAWENVARAALAVVREHEAKS